MSVEHTIGLLSIIEELDRIELRIALAHEESLGRPLRAGERRAHLRPRGAVEGELVRGRRRLFVWRCKRCGGETFVVHAGDGRRRAFDACVAHGELVSLDLYLDRR